MEKDNTTETTPSTTRSVPIHRRLIAMFYDFVIGGTLAAIFAFIISYILETQGRTIPADSILAYSVFAMELLVGFLYFQWFCLHKGQSLGMSVWKMRIANLSGGAVTYTQVLIRYVALLGILLSGFLLGYKVLAYSATGSIGIALLLLMATLLWSFMNTKKLALHEVISGTQLIDLR